MATTNPPTTGPTSIATWKPKWLRATPAATWSLSSSRATNVRRAGAPAPAQAAWIATAASTGHSRPGSVTAWTTSSAAATAWPHEVRSTSLLRSIESASVPPTSPPRIIGIAWASPTAPTAIPLPDVSHTW